MKFEILHNIKLNDGKTIKEHNLEKKHGIAIGALVETKYDEWFGDGACTKIHARLFVTRQTRDCDGTPLYSIGPKRWDGDWESHGHAEEDLKVIELTASVIDGEDALAWDDDEAQEKGE